jgi:hypothetical protein
MDHDERERVARSWLEVQRHWWAFVRMDEFLRDDPAGAFAILETIIDQAQSGELLGDVGAGPLEDFVRKHGAVFIDRIEEHATRDRRWREALSGVWIPDGDDPLTQRLERIGCTQLRNRELVDDNEGSG